MPENTSEENSYKAELYGKTVDVLRLPVFINGQFAQYPLELVDQFPDVFERYSPPGVDYDDEQNDNGVVAIRTGARHNSKLIKESAKSELQDEWKKVGRMKRLIQAWKGDLSFSRSPLWPGLDDLTL